MRLFRHHVVLAAILAAGCGTAPQFGDRMVAQVTPLLQSEKDAALLEQPALHARMTIRWHELLKAKSPELRDKIDPINRRSVALNRLELRAAHALAYRDFKDKTMEEVVNLMTRWMAAPGEYILYMERVLGQIENQPIEQVAALARELPQVYIARENLMGAIPAGPTAAGMGETELIIDAVFTGLKANAKPADAVALEVARNRLVALSNRKMRALHAAIWQEIKGKTMAELTEQADARLKDPGLIAEYLDKHLDKIDSLSDDAIASMASSYPEVLAQVEEAFVRSPKLAPGTK